MGNLGEENEVPAIELLRQEVEAWCVAEDSHMQLDKAGSVLGSQNGKEISPCFLFHFFKPSVDTFFCNKLIGKKTSQYENIVFTVPYTLSREKEV